MVTSSWAATTIGLPSHSNDQFNALTRCFIYSSDTTYLYSILSPPTVRHEYCKI